MLSSLVSLLTTVCAVAGAVVLGTYLVPLLIFARLEEQDLRKKYGAKWAVVTGGSSGIGAAIARKLASQGISVAVAALDDPLLASSVAALKRDFPGVEVRAVGCDLSEECGAGQEPAYMKKLREATEGVDVQLVFCNAGYIKPGIFPLSPLAPFLANYHTNATSATRVAHHFASRMVEKKLRGLVTFTSSSAYWVPTPVTTMYGPTKAYLAQLGANLACELRPFGVDVVVLHPSPTDTGFYGNVKDVSVLSGAQKLSVPPSEPASALFRAAGRVVVVDQGWMNAAFKLVARLVDWSVLVEALAAATRYTGDFKKELAKAGGKKAM